MTRWLTILLCILPAFALAQNERAPEIPELKVEIITPGGEGGTIFVQQQVLMKVTLTSRHPFRTLQIEMPPITNAEAHVASRARTREFSTYGGSGWRHQSVTALFPLRSGKWLLPAITATGSVTHPDGTTHGFEARTRDRTINVQPAHPYLNGFWWVAAEHIALSESWSTDLSTMRIGDTVRRTVKMTGTGTTAERLPELRQEITPGASFAAAGGTQTTRFTPDGAIGEVTRSWDITVTTEDPVNLPPVSVTWWHTGESRPASSGVPAGRIEPFAVDADKLRAELLAEALAEQNNRAIALFILLVLLVAPVAVIGAAVLLSLVPSPADLRLRRELRAQSSANNAKSVVRWGQSTVNPAISTVNDLLTIAPAEAASVIRDIQISAYGAGERAAASHRNLVRWSRHLRLAKLGKRLTQIVKLIAGETAPG